MPLPQSRIGRVVLLGIVLGLLGVFAVAAFATVAHAQELPTSVKAASPYPDSIVCRGWQMFESFSLERRIEDAALNGNLTSVRERLRHLCRTAPDDQAVGTDSAAWLSQVDTVFDTITMSLFDRMARPISAGDRAVLRDILQTTALFQRDVQLLRTQVYTAETIKVVESVKTVEVPVHVPCPRCPDLVCPQAPECPQGPDPSEVAEERRRMHAYDCRVRLNAALSEWEGRLNTNYLWAKDEYGAALYAAGDLNNQINRCAGNNRPCNNDGLVATVVGWERALGDMVAVGGRGPGGMSPLVLQRIITLRSAMAAKLEGCRGGEGRR